MSEDSLFREIEEDLQRDRYQKLVRKYGGWVVAAAVLVVAATAGTVSFQSWQEGQREQATTRLLQAVIAAGGQGGDAALAGLQAYAADAGPERAVLARLIAAGTEARAGDVAGATEIYRAVAADGATTPTYRDLAILLGVLAGVGTEDPAQLEGRIKPLTEPNSPWRYSALELTGLIKARAGDGGRAAEIFRQLADDPGAPSALRGRAGELAELYGRRG